MKRLTGTSVPCRLNAPQNRALRNALKCVATALGIATLSALVAGQAAAQTYWSSNGNILLGNNCQSLLGLTVSLHVTQDMLATTSDGSDLNGATVPNGGFSLQLNATPPQGPSYPVYWLQYLIVIKGNRAYIFPQYWYPRPAVQGEGVNEPPETTILSLPSNMIPAGWVLTIALTNDPVTGNVTGATFSITDNAGKTTSVPMVMPTYSTPMNSSLNNTNILAPIKVLLVNVVGPPSYETSTFSSGAGYITYGVSSGQLGLTLSSACGVETTDEASNASYGMISPSVGSTLVQPVTTPFAGALASNMDTADNIVQVYHFTQYLPPTAQSQNTGNCYLNEFAFNGTWSSNNVTTTAGAPAATLGSPVASYENTLYNAPEAFYFVPISQGGQQIEQLWSKTWSPKSLTSLANAQPAALGSGLGGYIDPIAATDNVFYQGTDQHVHLLTWSPGGNWAEDPRLANAPAATFAGALTGHMSAKSEEIFYMGTNQHIYELWRWSKNFDGWHSTDVTLANGQKPLPAIGSPLAGFYDAKAGTDAVFYVGTDRHVRELVFSLGRWTGVDVTLASNTLPAGLGSTLAAHLNTVAGSEEVFFVNSDQTIEELWSWSTAAPTWNASNVSHAAGSPALASPGSPLTTDINSVSSTKTDELYYVGNDGNVYQLWWSPNTGQWSASTP
ncbi:MAG: hypothetical protein ACHQZS_00310 [Candidatus Binatales bacterium]